MYNIILKKPAKKFLRKLDSNSRNMVLKRLKLLRKNPSMGIPLGGKLRGLWKLRIGKYRAICELNSGKLVIYVLTMGHRKNVYKQQ
ncbi:type II toxin-antitoxin system RelE/ParE family toxin [archaeon]|jgi:mRNA interferase RelE/StbE|nr:type II toxin-antitoxin system RelE/ParE family toxin [archaeon]MBT3577270.1 type II toxin-antitoxin system RelE/ParE family toxin [archaeon]MBT6820488.1 type II toxin-antitoxin system RelE/ParE family toxin [archaeon]MBT6955827.1 type II toxin-antitoxin system RelE/ParE family toxin [archaeon]MBT7025738.1 type II toxin-antitoxin system RelE/ParE family toxin [archaeon]